MKGAGKNKAGGWYRSGYFAGDYDCQAGDEAAGDGDNYEWNEDYGEGAYVGYGDEPTTDDPDDCDWVSDEDLGITLTAMAACDVDETSTDGLEELGEACQHQLQPMQLWNVQRGKDPTRDQEKAKTRTKEGQESCEDSIVHPRSEGQTSQSEEEQSLPALWRIWTLGR